MNSTLQLYEIHEMIYSIMNSEESFNPETGELLPEAERQFKALNLGKERLCKDVALYGIECDHTAEIISQEIKRLQGLKKSYENRKEAVKKILRNVIPEGEKMDLGTVKVSWRKSEQVVVDEILFDVESFGKLHPELVKVTTELKKTEVKQYIKNTGVTPEGIEIKTNNSLQIK